PADAGGGGGGDGVFEARRGVAAPVLGLRRRPGAEGARGRGGDRADHGRRLPAARQGRPDEGDGGRGGGCGRIGPPRDRRGSPGPNRRGGAPRTAPKGGG